MSSRILILLSSFVVGGSALSGEPVEGTLAVGNVDRTFHVVEPSRRSSPTAAVLHGAGQTPATMRSLAGWEPLGAEEGFVVVYPEGIDRSWNDGDDSKPATRDHVDDAWFVEALVTHLVDELGVDGDRVYAAGFSNGGFMLLRHACRLRDRVAAVGIVAAGVHREIDVFCDGSRTFPAAFILGTDDPAVPWDGWPGYRGLLPRDSGVVWARMNKCDRSPEIITLPDRERDGTVTHRETYSGCADGATVLFLRVEGGGHTWPGGEPYRPAFMVGRTARDWSATRALWTFFDAHPRRPIRPGLAAELREELARDATIDSLLRVVDTHLRRSPHVDVEFEVNRLGYALLREDRAASAVRILRINVRRFPDSFNSHDSLGEAWMELGEREEAIWCYRRAVELNPTSDHSRRMLDRLLEEASE